MVGFVKNTFCKWLYLVLMQKGRRALTYDTKVTPKRKRAKIVMQFTNLDKKVIFQKPINIASNHVILRALLIGMKNKNLCRKMF
jgi:hypothetical protein